MTMTRRSDRGAGGEGQGKGAGRAHLCSSICLIMSAYASWELPFLFRPAKAASGAANAIAADRTTAAPERIALSTSVSDRADATGRAATARRAVLAEAAGLTARSCCALAETANIF